MAQGVESKLRATLMAAVAAAVYGCGALGALTATPAAFVGGAPGTKLAASRAADAAVLQLDRRGALTAGFAAMIGGTGAVEQALAAEARNDAICSVKCIEICKDKLKKTAKNMEYCDYTCDQYCSNSQPKP